jgi:nucleotide-binding universal stress UspA family protein
MKLLIATDLSASSNAILDVARDIARSSRAKVWLLHVAEPEPDFVGYGVGPQSVRDSQAIDFHREHVELQAIADRLRDQGIETTALLIQGATAATILQQASKLQVNMIVVGSHGHGAVHKMLVGSVSENVLRRATTPVLVVPTRTDDLAR